MITSEKTISINHPPAFMATTILKINNDDSFKKEDNKNRFFTNLLNYVFDFIRAIFIF